MLTDTIVAVVDPECQGRTVTPSPDQQAEAARIAARLATVGFVLPGTLIERMTRCGRTNCACHADPPALHGPYHQWTRAVHGKTRTRLLSDEQLADYQPWFDNQRQLRTLAHDLETLSLSIIESDPRTPRRH